MFAKRDTNLRIRLLVHSRDLDSASRSRPSAARHADLSTPIVELSFTAVGAMQTNMLSANEILAVLDFGGDLERNTVLVPSAPSILLDVATRVANGLLVDLEPATGAVIGSDRARGFRHVDLRRARVTHGGTDAESHGEGIASLDLGGAPGGICSSAKIAAEVGVEGGEVVESLDELGGHILCLTGVLTDELGRLLAVDNEAVEKVVGRDRREHASEESGGGGNLELHFERIGMVRRN